MRKSKIMDRISEFFSKLPSEEKDKWNEVYKKRCMKWIEKVGQKICYF